MSSFQRISMLISFVIFVNGITNNSYIDICNKTPTPDICNKCFFFNPGNGTGDVVELARIMIDYCASSQAQNLRQVFEKLQATDPSQSARAIYGNCASKFHDAYEQLQYASLALRWKNYEEAKGDVKTTLVFHLQCFIQLKNLKLPGDLGAYLRNFTAYALDTESIIDQIPI